jgi:hypothetical protein
LRENSDYEPQVYRRLCLKLFLALITALAVYFILDKIFVNFIFRTETSEYLDNMKTWGKGALKQGIIRILGYGYIVTIGHIPAIQAIVEPIIAHFSPSRMDYVRRVSNLSRLIGNVLLLPAVLCFIIQIGRTSRKKIPSGSRLLYILAGIGIPLSIMLLSIISGNVPPVRSMYALPFASAFMTFYLITKYKKRIAFIITGVALLVSIYQAQTTAQLFYSDYLRYQADVQLAIEVDRRIIQMDNIKKLPLAFIGKYEPDFKTNFLPGDVLGYSCFGWVDPSESTESTGRGLPFMQSLGINYEQPDEYQMNQAREIALSMPDYPAPGSVKCLEDIIVVKLSDSTYKPED